MITKEPRYNLPPEGGRSIADPIEGLLPSPRPFPSPAQTESTVPAATILVVDDDRKSALGLSLLLRLDGHRVRTEYDGLQGWRTAELQHPDIVILDIELPGIDGLEVARRIESSEWGRNALLIAITGLGDAEDFERSRLVGFDLHFVKPIDIEELRHAIHAHRRRTNES